MKTKRSDWARSVVLAIASISASSLTAFASGQELVDRIVAIVDRDVITLSEAEQVQALGALQQGDRAELRDVVERQIEATLIAREVERYPDAPIEPVRVDEAIQGLRESFPADSVFNEEMSRHGLDADALRARIREQLAVNRYLERRFRALVYVTDEEVQRYYREELAPSLPPDGLPPVEEVAEPIRRILEEREFNERVERWIAELKDRARIRRYVW